MGAMRYAPLFAPILAFVMALPAQAEKLSLNAISNYLNGLQTAEAGFRQINADGSTSTGRVFIRRPGRMRFEYAAPDRTVVLASGGQVAVFDGKSNQPPEQYPLKKTPLNLILARKVDLSRAKMVVGHSEANGLTIVTAQDPQNPEYGQLQMAFSANPVALRQWVVTDETGGRTTVVLEPLKTGQSYASSLFSINAEADKRKRRRN
ncbi:Outer-membrane lipoprotein carrier protein [Defluviimonas aquaemixtae]|uniref:Outer-membrane lipoprotein carrier protein n=1 Tax=Albidovulum aquaemixtae TaxID=1542388 RepID=A0A2R8BLB1_9RHOB|nr:Outer-membrane lipoprotein carrier protein [Defluviimonas aquaemixtae]